MYVSTVQTGFTSANTWEVPVLDGYSFSQDVETQNITLSEASCTPARGQKIFNTALNPVEVSFPTYIKPYDDGTGTNCVEQVIWEAFVGNDAVGTNAVPSTGYVNPMVIDFAKSDVHELGKINIIFAMDTTAYMVTDVGVNEVEFDFAIDAIAMLNWSGQGATITELPEAVAATWIPGTAGSGKYLAEGTTTDIPQFIKNKLSNIEVYADTKVDLIGYQTVNYGGAIIGSDLAGLAALTYSFNIAVDAGTEEQIDVIVAGGEDMDALIVLIEAQLDLATNTDLATCTISAGGDLIITSENTSAVAASLTSVVLNETGITAGAGLFTELGSASANMIFQGIMETQPGLDAGKQYLIPITGGSMTLTNNVTYLTPEELGKVNRPIAGGFTGTREFGGTLTAYLNTGTNKSGGLLTDLTTTAALNDATNRFYLNVVIGGCNAAPKVEVIMNSAQLTVPTFNVEDVLSTEIGFTAIGTDLNLRDEVVINYYAEDKA